MRSPWRYPIEVFSGASAAQAGMLIDGAVYASQSGATARTLIEREADLGWSVLAFAGADNEAKLATALASGEEAIYLPHGLNITVTAAKTIPAGTRLFGRGPGAKITASGTNINALVAGGNDVIVEDLEIVCCGSSGSYASYNGAALMASAKTGIVARRLKISNHRGWGIILVNCSDLEIEAIRATSANAPATPDHTQMFSDIGLIGSCAYASVRRCYLNSGQAFPILVQSVTDTATTTEAVEISDNVIRNGRGHGITLYSQNLQSATGSQVQGTGQDTWRGCVVARNRVFDTQGSLLWQVDGTKPFGTGIYIQGASGTLVTNNTVVGACVSTDTETLAPGGIGVTNCRDWSVISNKVRSSTWYGFYYANPQNVGTAGDVGLSVGNVGIGCTKAGTKIISACEVVCDGDVMSRNTTDGWELRDASSRGNYKFVNCIARKNTLDGLRTIGTAIPKVTIDSCEMSENTQHGIAINNSSASRVYLSNNRTLSNLGRGFFIGTGINVDVFENNYANGNIANLDYNLTSKFPTGQETVGDAAVTLTIQSSDVQRLTVALTASRAVTLEAANLRPGRKRRFVRAAGATGAFNWSIAAVVTLTAEKQWAEIQSDGTNWTLIGYGTLP